MLDQCEAFTEDNRSWNMLFSFLKENALVETGMVTFLVLWNNRNGCIHQLACRHSLSMKNTIENLVKEFIKANSVRPPPEQQT